VILVFDKAQKIAGFSVKPAAAAAWAPPPYANPNAFAGRELTIGDEFVLPATLTLPKGAGPFPAVVLVHGSGPNDRDETVGSIKPFKDLAWGLASRGVAVLRYDKRTFAHPERSARITPFTVKDEVVDDARAAVGAMAATAGVDPKRIFLLGHSLGGTVAPRIANDEPRLAGLIIMAGAARPIEDAMLDQMRYLGYGADTIASVARTVEQIKSPSLRPEDSVDLLGSRSPGAYWLDLRGYRPADLAASLSMPLLILQGGRDYQVTSVDYEAWKRALDGRPNATLTLYPALNHLFVAGTGPSGPEEYTRAGHVAAEVIRDIAAFVQR
jgi:dienelactone hydrolase